MDIFSNSAINLLQQKMDVIWLKQKITLDNIANVETPGYKSRYVNFEAVYEEACKSPNHKYTKEQLMKMSPSVRATVKVDNSTSMKLDGNNVDIDKEQLELARAQLEYEYLQNKINSDFSRLRCVISEGRK